MKKLGASRSPLPEERLSPIKEYLSSILSVKDRKLAIIDARVKGDACIHHRSKDARGEGGACAVPVWGMDYYPDDGIG